MGGGVMRAGLAAKFAGLATLRSPASFSERGFRRPASIHPPAFANSSIVAYGDADCAAVAGAVPAWDDDDSWELIGDDLVRDRPSNPALPAAVFGNAPSFAEAAAATFDLMDVVGQSRVSFSSDAIGDSFTKSFVSSQKVAIADCMPKQVMDAFSVLKDNTHAQSVVASLASDENVWDAVMKNEKLVEFYLRHINDSDSAESVTGSNGELSSLSDEPEEEGAIVELLRNLKLKVVKVVADISEYLHDMIKESESEEKRNSALSKYTASENFGKVAGTTFMALAILTIVVVLFKRS